MITTGIPGKGRTHTGVAVLGTGSYLPARVVSNSEAAAPAGVTGEWIARKTGIVRRRRAGPDQAASDLAVAAGRAALADAGVDPADLALIMVATSTPDSPQPPTASVVADRLGAAPGTAAFDVNAVCSGFVFALTAAERMLGDAAPGYALVVGTDVYSRILDPTDRRTAVLFGDGAGAVVLGPAPAPGRGLLAGRLAGFGADRGLIGVPAGGSRLPASADTLAQGLHWFRMDGRGVREFVETRLPEAVRSFLADAGVAPGDLAGFVPHQANGLLLADLADRLGIPVGRTCTTVEEYGNTGSASIAVTLDRAARAGRFAPGDLVLLAGFGGGMAIGLALLRW
ncbi:ketoacyl-ACP synthase III [Streptomyces sp. BE20]|uniref:3-oxoacyl-ACP synthase III family protein n=1 Tax=unclassified Streptomyces TaxID=2593676 RepID=UPI002E75D7A6|nr:MULTISPECIES: ketoacyl-ACP synthase III [unclassified Streptomyces]MED7949840.1 ketoacyl-ACP synthase III [Streptomyces sp. BE303]MEE1828097.1 ketoacyl-ACP synthase III [Streptomyces sp. BE20]